MKIAKSKESLSETATVGYFYEEKRKGANSFIRVAVPSDGRKPARVYIAKCKGNLILGCIKLDKAEYFLPDHYKGLIKKQLTSLIDFLNSPSEQPVCTFQGKEYKLRTQWDHTVILWNSENRLNKKALLPIGMNNNGYIVSPSMPDYSTLETVKPY